MPEDDESERDGDEPAATGPAAAAAEDPFDRRVAPYSAESTVDVDPVEPPERDGDAVEPDLPAAAIDEAERLTRLARRVPDDAEAEAYRERRDEVLAEHDYAARVRGDEGGTGDAADDDGTAGAAAGGRRGPTLVCHPVGWLDETGAIDPAAIDEIGRAVEVALGAAGDPEAWDPVASRNGDVVERVREAHGDVHGANAEAFATYVSNHHAKPIAAVTGEELRWFREEYYPRNVWPSDAERAALDRSLELVYAELDVPMPSTAGEE